MNAKKSFIGSFIALLIGSSCCWLSSLAVWLGGATIMTTIMALQSKTQIYFIILGIALALRTIAKHYA